MKGVDDGCHIIILAFIQIALLAYNHEIGDQFADLAVSRGQIVDLPRIVLEHRQQWAFGPDRGVLLAGALCDELAPRVKFFL